jgi:hypothetical protein
MNAQNLMRHEAVLAFLHIQKSKQLGETREYLALQVARCFGKGIYFARRIVTWEEDWLRDTLALDSVTTAAINRYYNRCARVIEAYTEGFNYGTKEFTERVYKGHRQVVDKTKW